MKKRLFLWLLVNSISAAMSLGFGQDSPRRLENPSAFNLPGGSRIEFVSFESSALGKSSQFSVFFPPSYERETTRTYPVVYFLHGLWNDHTSWAVERYGGIPSSLEGLMLEGQVPECLVVNPNGENSFYTDYLDGSRKFETLVSDELIRWVESHYRVRSGREHRTIGGVSMGGYGALKIAMKHPEKYAGVVGISPIVLLGDDPSKAILSSSSRLAQYLSTALQPVFGMPFDLRHWKANSLVDIASQADLDGLSIFFAFGTADRYNAMFPLEAGTRALSDALNARSIAHQYRIYENGPHGWQLVVDHLPEIAQALTDRF